MVAILSKPLTFGYFPKYCVKVTASIFGGMAVTMTVGTRFCCQNLDCRCEIEVHKTSMEATSNPRCCCGAEMKKSYAMPVLRELDDTATEFFGGAETVRKRHN